MNGHAVWGINGLLTHSFPILCCGLVELLSRTSLRKGMDVRLRFCSQSLAELMMIDLLSSDTHEVRSSSQLWAVFHDRLGQGWEPSSSAPWHLLPHHDIPHLHVRVVFENKAEALAICDAGSPFQVLVLISGAQSKSQYHSFHFLFAPK